MNVLLLQLDGKLPNIALMRIAAHHRARGDLVELRKAGNARAVQRRFGDDFDRVYASLIFTRTRQVAEAVVTQWPGAIVGGTGWSVTRSLEDFGITTTEQDYTLYPDYKPSIGFTQRGCRLRCGFCVVPKKEGKVRGEQTIHQLWRGAPWPRDLAIMDNDFFGQPDWRDHVDAINDGVFRVSLLQGINSRFLNDETAAAMASMNYRSLDFKSRRIYTAWDNVKDEKRLFAGLESLVKHGVKPNHILVYMLIGFAPGETHEDRERRRVRLRQFGALPYPMMFVERDEELSGFRRWVLSGWDMKCTWDEFRGARYQDRNMRPKRTQLPLLPEANDG